jgi:hypothetical protein
MAKTIFIAGLNHKLKKGKERLNNMSDSLLSGGTPAVGDSADVNAENVDVAGVAEPSGTDFTAGTGAGEFDPGLFEAVGLKPGDHFDETGKILGKYNSIGDLITGYKEATTKLRERNPGAPEAYTLDFTASEKFKHVDLTGDPLWEPMEKTFKELGITNDQAQKLVESHLDYQMANLPDLDAEKARLGENADKIIGDIKAFASKNLKTPDDLEGMEYIGRNANATRLIHTIISLGGEKPLPSGVNHVANTGKSALEERAAVIRSNPMFDADPKLQDQYVQLLTEISRLK